MTEQVDECRMVQSKSGEVIGSAILGRQSGLDSGSCCVVAVNDEYITLGEWHGGTADAWTLVDHIETIIKHRWTRSMDAYMRRWCALELGGELSQHLELPVNLSPCSTYNRTRDTTSRRTGNGESILAPFELSRYSVSLAQVSAACVSICSLPALDWLKTRSALTAHRSSLAKAVHYALTTSHLKVCRLFGWLQAWATLTTRYFSSCSLSHHVSPGQVFNG